MHRSCFGNFSYFSALATILLTTISLSRRALASISTTYPRRAPLPSSLTKGTMTTIANAPIQGVHWEDLHVHPDELRPSMTLNMGQCFNWRPLKTSTQVTVNANEKVIGKQEKKDGGKGGKGGKGLKRKKGVEALLQNNGGDDNYIENNDDDDDNMEGEIDDSTTCWVGVLGPYAIAIWEAPTTTYFAHLNPSNTPPLYSPFTKRTSSISTISTTTSSTMSSSTSLSSSTSSSSLKDFLYSYFQLEHYMTGSTSYIPPPSPPSTHTFL